MLKMKLILLAIIGAMVANAYQTKTGIYINTDIFAHRNLGETQRDLSDAESKRAANNKLEMDKEAAAEAKFSAARVAESIKWAQGEKDQQIKRAGNDGAEIAGEAMNEAESVVERMSEAIKYAEIEEAHSAKRTAKANLEAIKEALQSAKQGIERLEKAIKEGQKAAICPQSDTKAIAVMCSCGEDITAITCAPAKFCYVNDDTLACQDAAKARRN